MTWACEEFRLSKTDKTGTTRRAHLEAAGIENPNEKPFPNAIAHVWKWFQELHHRRSVGMDANPLTWEAMRAWMDLTGTRPTLWEASAIFALDDAYRASTGD